MALKLLGSLESSGGNVGIGTSSPDSKLHIEGSTDGTGTGADAILHVKQTGGWNGNQPWALYVEGYSYLNGFRINAADGIRALHKVASGGQLGFSVTDTAPITFTQSNSTERMRVHTNGYIGIGTTSPSRKLHVIDSTWDNSSGGGVIFENSNTVGASLTLKPTASVVTHGAKGWAIYAGGPGAAINDGNLGFWAHGTNEAKMVIQRGGNVGIGTTSPGSAFKLDVNGYIKANSRLYVRDSTKTVEIGTDYIQSYVTSGTGVNPIRFFTGGNEKARIDGNGKVGIGTTSPEYKLDISDSSSGAHQIALRNTGGGKAGIWFDAANGDLSGSDYAWLRQNNDLNFELGVDSLGGDILFTEGGSERMRISSGNVGIGTTAPIARLDVQSTGLAANPTIQIVNTSSSSFNHSINALAPNLTTGENNILVIGRAASTKNSGYIGYKYSAAGSNLNVLTFGHWGSDNLMNLTGDGKLGIGTQNPSYGLDVNSNAARIGSSSQTTTSLYITATNTAGAPAMASEIIMEGYEGRGKGIFYTDSSYGGEWFSGVGYSADHDYWQVGFKESGGNAEYGTNAKFRVKYDGTIIVPAYGAGILQTNASGVVSVDTNTYATQTWVGEQNYASDSAISTAVASYLPLAGGTMTGDLLLGANQLVFGNNNVAAPSTTDTHAGTRILLYSPGGSGNHYAIGVESNNMWFNSDVGYKWYRDSSAVMTLDSSSNLAVTGTVTGSNLSGTNTGDQDLSSYATQTWVGEQNYATDAAIGTAISNLVDSSPSTLNTLNELAAALGDDASFSTTVTNSIATKLPLAGGTITGVLKLDSELQFLRGGTEYSNYIRAQNYPSQNYTSSTAKYWLEYGAKGGHHFVLNTDGGAGSAENAYDDFTIWNGAVDGDRLLEVTNAGNATLAGSLNTNSINIGSTVTLTESTDRADLLYINSATSGWGGLQIGNTSNEFIFSLMGNGNAGGIYDDQNGDWIIYWDENAGAYLYYNGSQKLKTNNTGVEVIGNLTSTGEVNGKNTYTKSFASLNTTGEDVAGLVSGGNGNSASFTFTCHGHAGGYQKIVYSCYNTSATTWNVKKVIDEGTNDFDVTVSASGATRTFTFVSRSGTKSYSPMVHVEHVGHGFDSSHI